MIVFLWCFCCSGGMAGQHYCLRWNNYQSNMTSVFHQLLQTEAFVDVTLACNEASLKAHKVSESNKITRTITRSRTNRSVLNRIVSLLIVSQTHRLSVFTYANENLIHAECVYTRFADAPYRSAPVLLIVRYVSFCLHRWYCQPAVPTFKSFCSRTRASIRRSSCPRTFVSMISSSSLSSFTGAKSTCRKRNFR